MQGFHADNMGVDGGFDALEYSYAFAPAALRATSVRGERALWCAVIMRAFEDLGAIAPEAGDGFPHPSRARSLDFHAAAHWLLHDNKDFIRICDLAGVSPQFIRNAARLFFSETQCV